MTPMLNLNQLASLPEHVLIPQFDPRELELGILHLGMGAFHRGHMAWYTQRAMQATPRDLTWGIAGVSFRRGEVKQKLQAQDCLYALAAREDDEQSLEVIGSVREISFLAEDLERILQHLANPRIRIVSLTVTEKGYCLDPATGELDASNPGIREDLKNPQRPITAIGLLAEGLRLRCKEAAGPLAILSCDNLPANGKTLARVLKSYIGRVNPELMAFVDAQISFPSCVLDRIIPATTAGDQSDISLALQAEDKVPVVSEKFSQWVVEDNFKAGRPAWEAAGVTLVKDVADYETLKLRLLNGPHSACAYLGYLAGFETVAALMSNPSFPRFLNRLMAQEVIPGLQLAPQIDCQAYRESVLHRFANQALAHRTWQIAMDGSQKLPQRLLDSVRRALLLNLPLDCLALSISAWMRFATAMDEQGNPIEVSDPLAERFQAIASTSGADVPRLVEGLLGIREIFGTDLAANDRFRSALIASLQALYEKGAGCCVDALAASA